MDTSSQRASLALLEGNDLAAELRLQARQTHSTVLLGSIDFLLCRLGWKLSELGLIAVGIGPGSFTGIRIGMATALGIAQSLAIPLAGVSGFDALAHQIKGRKGFRGLLGVVLDAQRGQAFYAEYAGENGRMRMVTKPALISLVDLECCLAQRHLYIVGDIEVCRLEVATNDSKGWPRALDVDMFLAPAIGQLAWCRKGSWRSGEYLKYDPLYIRPPDALRNRKRNR